MNNNEKLYKIFEAIIDGVELTTKNLKDLGYSSNDLNALIKDESLIRVRRGLYSLNNVDGLLYYGKGLLVKKQYDRAYETFNKCYEIDPNNSSVCFQMFLRAVKTRDYEGAIKLYDKISNTDNEYYNTDAKFYLFLLSLVTELPQEYKDYVNKLSYEDMKMNDDDKRSGNVTISNNVRYNAYIGKLAFALKTLNDLIRENASIKTHEIIIKSLLHDAILVDKEQKTTVLNLVKEEKYEEAIKFLLNKQCMHRLFSNDESVLTLLQKLVEIRDTKIVPQYSKYLGNNAFEAVYQNDYETALLLSTNYNKKMGIPDDENSINILLTEICELIKSLSDNKKVEEVKPEEVKTDKETLILNGLTTVVSYLLKKDYDGAYDSLAKYMESINKQKYEVLIKTLIQIGVLENDVAFAKALIYLAQIGNDSFVFNTDEYLSNFYLALSKNRKDIAELYLDIISKSSFFVVKRLILLFYINY